MIVGRVRKAGTKRSRIKFAWTPTACTDGTIRKWERVEVIDSWHTSNNYALGGYWWNPITNSIPHLTWRDRIRRVFITDVLKPE